MQPTRCHVHLAYANGLECLHRLGKCGGLPSEQGHVGNATTRCARTNLAVWSCSYTITLIQELSSTSLKYSVPVSRSTCTMSCVLEFEIKQIRLHLYSRSAVHVQVAFSISCDVCVHVWVDALLATLRIS